MNSIQLISAIIAFAFGMYLVRVGYLLISNKKYRNKITNLWVVNKTSSDEKISMSFVKYVDGPIYIIMGLSIIVFAISLVV